MHNYSNFQKYQKAAALGYDKKNDIAPKILSSGEGNIAKQIIEIAKENNIPIYENAELTDILSLLEVNEYIPLEIYAIIAEILAHLNKNNSKTK